MNDIKLNSFEQLINDYLVSLTNLYGVFEQEQFVKIFNKYNEKKIKKELLSKLSFNLNNLRNGYFIYENIITTSFITDSILDEIIMMQKGKPYYFPTLKEIKECFLPKSYEQNHYVISLKEYILNELKVSPLKIDHVMYEIILDIKSETEKTNRLKVLEKYDVKFTSINQVDEYMKKYNMVHGSTRLWANKGYSAMQITRFNKEKIDSVFVN